MNKKKNRNNNLLMKAIVVVEIYSFYLLLVLSPFFHSLCNMSHPYKDREGALFWIFDDLFSR